MKLKQFIITALVGITAFAAGFLLRTVWSSSPDKNVRTGSNADQTYQSGPSASQGQVMSQGQVLSQDQPFPQGEGLPPAGPAETENTVCADNIQVRIDDGQVQWYDGIVWHTVASVEELSGEDRYYLAQEFFQSFIQELQQEKLETPSLSPQEGTFMAKDAGISVGQKETPKPTPKPSTPKPSIEESAPQEPAAEPIPAAPSVPAAPANPAPSVPTAPPESPAPATPAPADPSSSGDGEDIEWTPDME